MTQTSLFEDNSFSFLDELGESEHGMRYYQEECVQRVEASLRENRSALVVMATGLGKTQVFVHQAQRFGGSVLFLAHRDELIQQAKDRIEQITGEYVATEKADETSHSKTRLVVGSVQSFNPARLERLGRKRFDLVIVDEAHHALAMTYRRVIDWFSEAKIAGYTATPDRTDEKALGQVFDDVAYVMDIEEGINAGYLVPILGKRVRLDAIDLSDVGKTGQDLAVGQLDEAILKAVEGIVRKTLELEPDRQGIAFFPGVKSAEYAANAFNRERPGSACFVSGSTPIYERQAMIRDFRNGVIRYLCNCMVATEGFDAPAASMVIQGRPTLSRSLYAQMIGRGTRPLPGIPDAIPGPWAAAERQAAIAASEKPDVVILDFVGNSGKHSLMGVEDVLGGNYSEAEIKLAKKRNREQGGNIKALLEAARRELQELAKKTEARVHATVSEFNPFRLLDISPDEDQYVGRFGSRPPTEGQLGLLRRRKVAESDLRNLSRRQASALLTEMSRRISEGLASYAQLAQLRKYGVTESDIPYERASAAMNYIARKGWRDIDPVALNEIIHHQREPGED